MNDDRTNTIVSQKKLWLIRTSTKKFSNINVYNDALDIRKNNAIEEMINIANREENLLVNGIIKIDNNA